MAAAAAPAPPRPRQRARPRARGGRALLALLLALAAALPALPGAAAPGRRLAAGCMKHCARCAMLPAPYAVVRNRRNRLVQTCLRAQLGYLPSIDRLSVDREWLQQGEGYWWSEAKAGWSRGARRAF